MSHAASLSNRTNERLDHEQFKARLMDLWERTGDETLRRLAEGSHPWEDRPLREGQERSDWISTCVMNCFKNSGDTQVFSLLYELNEEAFLHAVQAKARRTGGHVDAHDVVQDVFLNIFRYPHRFLADRADAFRNWGHRIARNTLLKSLRGQGRVSRCASLDDENMVELADAHARAPDRSAVDAESAHLVDQAYLMYLNLYLFHFDRLSPKERTALTMVEVDGSSYREVADALGIRLENLKMVIFRGRRKVLRGMTRSLSDLGSEAPLESPLTPSAARDEELPRDLSAVHPPPYSRPEPARPPSRPATPSLN